MIVFQRTGLIAGGKQGDAIAFAHRIADVFKDVTGVGIDVMIPIGGNPFQVTWRGHCDSLAAMDDAQSKTMANQKYLETVAAGVGLFIEGTFEDEIWRTV